MKTQKNGKKSITRTLMVGAICMALAGVCMLLLTPNTTLATHKEGHNPGGGGGGGDDSTVKLKDNPVSVKFRDYFIEGGLMNDRVLSDNGTPYATYSQGRDKVRASMDKYGRLRMSTWDSTTRWIEVNLPVGSRHLLSDYDPQNYDPNVNANFGNLGEDLDNDGILTPEQLAGNFGHHLNLLEMPSDPDDPGSSVKAGVQFAWPVAVNEHWRLRYGDDQNPKRADLATVTRHSETEWTIEAGAEDAAMAALMTDGVVYDYISMPFKITVVIEK